jgi:uncharacterized protein (AIM24 family)
VSDYRTKIDEKAGRGAHFELYQFIRKSYALGMSMNAGGEAAPIRIPHGEPVSARQLRIVLNGGSALLEPGALQYAKGKLSVEVQKNESGGFFGRALRSAGTGESGFATRYSGNGEVWSEPTSKHFIIAEMDGPDDALILDDKAFYACEASVQVKTHMHRSVTGVLSGNGPVPVDEIEEIVLDGSGELIVDGDLMMMYSASLNVELRPLVRGLRNALRSGEGLVFVFTGKGTVWLTPTMRL